MTALDLGQNWYDGYFWSPAGKYIALYLYQEDNTDRLVLLDTQTGKFTNTCLNFTPDRTFATSPPVWSPDESQLILEDRVSALEGGGFPRLILVDLVQGTAAQIAADTEIKGWIIGSH